VIVVDAVGATSKRTGYDTGAPLNVREEQVVRWDRGDFFSLLLIIALATALRVIFYPGMLLSDDVTYTDGASKLLHGDWSPRTYIGSLRYGVDLPVAFFLWVFGENEIAANLWSFLSSLVEVAAIFAAGRLLWNRSTAIIAAGLLAFLPLHVSIAGRLLADAPLGAFITSSFVLFLYAENRRSAVLYVVAGLACGFSFWIKQSVMILYCFVFLVYALAYRIWRWQWVWLGLGIVAAAGSNCLFFWAITGDPLYLLWVMTQGMQAYRTWDFVDTSGTFYLWRLFVDVRHTAILGYFVLGGLVLFLLARLRGSVEPGTSRAVLWAVALVAIFSFAPVSFNPVKLVMKQSNYMLIFAAPLCLVAGYFLARIRPVAAVVLGGGYIAVSLLLAGLVQQDTRAFTANSWAAVQFARAHAPTPVFGMQGAFRASAAAYVFAGRKGERQIVRELSALADGVPRQFRGDAPESIAVYAIVDLHTAHWGNEPIQNLNSVPACWQKIARLEHPPIQGAGARIVALLQALARSSPVELPGGVRVKLDELANPRPAYVFGVPGGCAFRLTGGGRG